MDEIDYPLNRSPVVRTRNPEEMRDALRTVYGATGFSVANSIDFEGVANYLILPHIGLGFCGYAAKTIVDFPEGDFARLQVGLKGKASVILDTATTVPVDEQHLGITSPGQPSTIIFEAGFEQLILRIKTAALDKALATLLGAPPRGTLLFNPTTPPKQPAAHLLRQLTMFLADQLNSTAAQLPKPALVELEQALIMTFLSAHRHNYTELLESPATEPAPLAVRLAEEYIEANWARAVLVEELAAQTNTSIRSLYAAFKKNRGYSPMQFAKSVRLRRARQMLLEGNPRTSVSQIAFKCGFANLGHFANDFRKMFGELPSEVFARGRRLK
ncbi:AraC family transcriptional regulator [Bradyrhizobium sp. IC3069]|uniref:AraC family transcriptional regulator n=1 Tax=unclassified Bradyrhizobium TaxID=2631580 RepID=UPI001CD46FAF|nr:MULTISPECIES: AraC family transcriptional regulator [unclassified Bradyrhizobium]MCA1363755.1 AraC family transcriptional regulator [Bradyrhizobium sp. IC4059]MCA1521180.1 AraC family transcriptional regulator [Bradyrhizobium sp. IC3069]